jgi:ethanolamine utilization protein EutN
MRIGKVIGTVVATRKDERLVGAKLLITVPVDARGEPDGQALVAVDMVGAGIGERVLFATGSVAARALGKGDPPVDAVIVGIVDAIEGGEG